jgi:O-antigen/teichoic acid export membrane protein
MFFAMFIQSWQISVLEEFGKNGYSDFFNRIFRLVITGLIFCLFIISIASKVLIYIFTTEDYYEAWRYVPILTLGVVLSCTSGLAGSSFSAARESKYYFYSSVWGALTSILCNLLLIPRFGILGAAISVPISFAVMAVSRIAYGWKYVKIKYSIRYVLMLLISIMVIAVIVNFQINSLKYAFILILFLLFLAVNYDMKNEILKMYKGINFGRKP